MLRFRVRASQPDIEVTWDYSSAAVDAATAVDAAAAADATGEASPTGDLTPFDDGASGGARRRQRRRHYLQILSSDQDAEYAPSPAVPPLVEPLQPQQPDPPPQPQPPLTPSAPPLPSSPPPPPVGILLGGGGFTSDGTTQPWRQVFIPIDPTFFATKTGGVNSEAAPEELASSAEGGAGADGANVAPAAKITAQTWNRIIWRDVSGSGGELQLRDIALESYVSSPEGTGSAASPPSTSQTEQDAATTQSASYTSAPPAPAAPSKALAESQIEAAGGSGGGGSDAYLGFPPGASLANASLVPPGTVAPSPGGYSFGDDGGPNLGLIVVVFMVVMVAFAALIILAVYSERCGAAFGRWCSCCCFGRGGGVGGGRVSRGQVDEEQDQGKNGRDSGDTGVSRASEGGGRGGRKSAGERGGGGGGGGGASGGGDMNQRAASVSTRGYPAGGNGADTLRSGGAHDYDAARSATSDGSGFAHQDVPRGSASRSKSSVAGEGRSRPPRHHSWGGPSDEYYACHPPPFSQAPTLTHPLYIKIY